MNHNDADFGTWLVLVNDEQQYSLWQASRPVPAGWREIGPEGTRQECLDWIGRTWVDQRPKSAR